MNIKIPLLLLIIIILSVIIFKSAIFSIKNVEVVLQNAPCLTQDQVQQQLKLDKTNIIFLDEDKIERILKNNFFCVDKVKTERSIPQKVKIEINGRRAFIKVVKDQQQPEIDLMQIEASSSSTSALLNWDIDMASGSGFIADRQGVIFGIEEQPDLPVIHVNDDLKLGFQFKETSFINLQQVLDGLLKEYYGIEGKVVGENLMIKTPQKIVFSLKKDASRQVASLQLILQKAKINAESMELIDLRFDKPIVIYNPKK